MADEKSKKKVSKPAAKADPAVKKAAPAKPKPPITAKAVKAAIPQTAKAKTVSSKATKVKADAVKTAGENAGKTPAAARPKPGRRALTARPVSDQPLSVKVYSMKGEESGSLDLPESIFGEKPNQAVMHQAVRRQLANARQGTAATKKRDQVSGGGKKPFRQKGLGRSRHGSEREPSMVGGGTVFGPQPRSFRLEMPRKMRRLALRSALSVKAAEGQVSIIDSFSMEAPRTRTIVDLLESVGVEGTALVVLAGPNEAVARSMANLPWAKTILAHNLNLYDLFTHDHIVLAQDAVELIEETFSR